MSNQRSLDEIERSISELDAYTAAVRRFYFKLLSLPRAPLVKKLVVQLHWRLKGLHKESCALSDELFSWTDDEDDTEAEECTGDGSGDVDSGTALSPDSLLYTTMKETEALLKAHPGLLEAQFVDDFIQSKMYFQKDGPAVKLFYTVGLVLGFESASLQNSLNAPCWDAILTNCIADYAYRMATYSPSAPRLGAPKANTLASIKAFAKSSGILDPSVYPANMALCSVAVLPWLQKAIAAREAAIAYHAEIQVALE